MDSTKKDLMKNGFDSSNGYNRRWIQQEMDSTKKDTMKMDLIVIEVFLIDGRFTLKQKLSFDKDGFNKKGYDENGFNKEGFNKNGFDNQMDLIKNGFESKDGFD